MHNLPQNGKLLTQNKISPEVIVTVVVNILNIDQITSTNIADTAETMGRWKGESYSSSNPCNNRSDPMDSTPLAEHTIANSIRTC